MTSKIATKRVALHSALRTALDPYPWRVHKTPPGSIAAPCMYIGAPDIEIEGSGVALTFPVTAVWDGQDARQVENLDELMALAWDAAYSVGGRTETARSIRLDVGGPTLRAVELAATFTVTGLTLCQPSLQEVI